MIGCQGTGFVLDGRPFTPRGINAYYLPYCSTATQRRVLAEARTAGANTCRTWAFEHLERSGGLDGLDRLLALAEETGVYLILPLVNNWPDFGGTTDYAPAGEFFRSAQALAAYSRWAERLLTRRNAATGRRYGDEPAVLAWELANEPRKDKLDPPDAVGEWARQASEAVKRLDQKHLLAIGDEGFFRKPWRWRHRFGPSAHLYDGRYGIDTPALLKLPAVDFGTYHLYPLHWGMPARFGARWIQEHVQAGHAAGKPVVLEEFGLPEDHPQREAIYREWTEAATAGGGGALVWMAGCAEADSAAFRDRYTLHDLTFLKHAGEEKKRKEIAES